mmetsp:Transcript_98210/g.282460  ORF Transcript_98210/g.282460 Transcript_98210/m.282460 type:complete len:246 (-) Transcript_98210:142-879(-)
MDAGLAAREASGPSVGLLVAGVRRILAAKRLPAIQVLQRAHAGAAKPRTKSDDEDGERDPEGAEGEQGAVRLGPCDDLRLLPLPRFRADASSALLRAAAASVPLGAEGPRRAHLAGSAHLQERVLLRRHLHGDVAPRLPEIDGGEAVIADALHAALHPLFQPVAGHQLEGLDHHHLVPDAEGLRPLGASDGLPHRVAAEAAGLEGRAATTPEAVEVQVQPQLGQGRACALRGMRQLRHQVGHDNT